MKLRYAVIGGLAVWAVLGSPMNYAAGVFWPAKPRRGKRWTPTTIPSQQPLGT